MTDNLIHYFCCNNYIVYNIKPIGKKYEDVTALAEDIYVFFGFGPRFWIKSSSYG